ncbi:MAG: hypothetical protein ACREQ5_02910 [Candidatus Dormibacteria bacterium]
MGKKVTFELPDDGTGVDIEARQAEELAQLNEDEGGELFRVTDELRGTVGARLMIVRTYPTGPDSSGYVGELTPGEFSIERMRSLFGPGRYRVRVVGPKGFLPGGGPVHIAKSPNDNVSAQSGGIADLATLIKTLDDRQAQAQAQKSERFGKLTELAIPGLLTIIAAVLGKNTGPDIGTLITALRPQPGPGLADLTTALANMKALTGGTDSMAQLENFFKAAELFREMAGGKGAESNWIDVFRDVIKEAVPAVRPMLENMQVQLAERARAAAAESQLTLPAAPLRSVFPAPTVPLSTPAPVTSATSVPPVPVSPVSSSGEQDMLQVFMPLIKEQVNKLLKWAVEQKRADLYAEVFLDELPQLVAQYVSPEQALQWLQHPNWWQYVREKFPEAQSQFVWLDKFRTELIAVIEDQIDETKRDASVGDHPSEVHPAPPQQITDPEYNGNE